MVPEIWSTTEIIFCHSGPFFALLLPYGPRNQNFQRNGKNIWRYNHFTNISNSHMRYGSSNMKCNGQNFLSSWAVSCSFTPLTNPKNDNFEKMKKKPGDIIILHRCNINENHMMYDSWDTDPNGQNVFALLPPNNLKNQNFEKLEKKTPGNIIILHMCTKNHVPMLHCFLDVAHWFNYFSFWAIFCPFTSLTTKKIKI